MIDLPLVSIITPSFNQADFIGDTIQSVLSSDYPNIEYIVIDGGSTDESVDIIRSYEGDLKYWISEPDTGQSNAINKGLLIAQGDILGWLNSDDTFYPNTVSRVVNYFLSNQDVDLVYGFIKRIDHLDQEITKPKLLKNPPTFNLKTIIADRYIIQPGSFWRREIMEVVGYLKEDLHYIMDYEYWTRIALAGGKFGRIEGEPLANFRISEMTKTHTNPQEFAIEEMLFIDTLMADPSLPSRMGITPKELDKLSRKARANAHLMIFRSHFKSTRDFEYSYPWLIKAIKIYPLIGILRWRLLLSTLRSRFKT